MLNESLVKITFVTNGEPFTVQARPGVAMKDARHVALVETKNLGASGEWMILDEQGYRLDPEQTVAALRIKDGARLVLALPAGIGG